MEVILWFYSHCKIP